MELPDIAKDDMEMSPVLEAALVAQLKAHGVNVAKIGVVIVIPNDDRPHDEHLNAFVLHTPEKKTFRICDMRDPALASPSAHRPGPDEIVKYIYPTAYVQYCGIIGGRPRWIP